MKTDLRISRGRAAGLSAALGVVFLFASGVQAQWQTTTYTLKGGWNGISLTGDASYAPIDTVLPPSVLEVWRWNPNATQVQFTSTPQLPTEGTPEWSVWRREGTANTFSLLTGPGTYLVKCSGTSSSTHFIPIKQSPRPPSSAWVRNGANLLGFSTFKNGANFPTFGNYFATFPEAIAAGTNVYKYIGGDLGPNNTLKIFSPAAERIDRTQAYWFSAKVVADFYGPLEVSLSNHRGLTFGDTGTSVTARILNRTAAPVTLTLAPVQSEPAPSTEQSIAGSVPLTRRQFDPVSLDFQSTPITGAYTEVIPPNSSSTLTFGVDRAALGGATGAFFASLLRLTDSNNQMDVYLPVSATKISLAGLWIGEAKITGVASQVAGYTGTTTPREFPLRTLLHVTDAGAATLLSQVFLGRLASGEGEVGLSTREALLRTDAKASAQRFVAAHLPLDQVISGSGGIEAGSSLSCVVTVPFNDATNPFVHQYHPDHDNKDARFQPAGAGVESYNISRTCTFNFTEIAPAGSGVTSGWGSSAIGGTYQETITGIHKNPIQVSGTFVLRRASEIGTLTQ